MATISVLHPQRRITSPIERAITDTLEAVTLSYAHELAGRRGLSRAEISAALRQPVSFAAVIDDVCRWLEIEVPPSVEDALS